MTEKDEILFDVQSKNDKNMSPKKLGRYLVTLFKNYVSSIEFDSYYLTIPCNLNEKNIKKNVHSKSKTARIIDYLEQDALRKVGEGLFEEINDKTYLNKYVKSNTDVVIKDEINKFLSKTYVVILSVEHEQLVLNFLENKSLNVDKVFLKNIFNEIRDAQNKLKQINVENLTLNVVSEAVDLKKHFVSEELRTLVFNRIIMLDFCDNSLPLNFVYYVTRNYSDFSEWELKELYTDCIDSIRKTIFDKNSKKVFWTTFCEIYNLILNHPNLSITEIYQKLERNFIDKMKFLRDSEDVYIYFIALIQNGVKGYLEEYEN
ncbi:hypothetical protein [Enterococcus caccae]|nr:hypothetical protein [Enterococcus caccae]